MRGRASRNFDTAIVVRRLNQLDARLANGNTPRAARIRDLLSMHHLKPHASLRTERVRELSVASICFLHHPPDSAAAAKNLHASPTTQQDLQPGGPRMLRAFFRYRDVSQRPSPTTVVRDGNAKRPTFHIAARRRGR